MSVLCAATAGSAMAEMTTRVHCKRDCFDFYIGRPSRWGNPFRIGRDGTRSEVVQKFRAWLQEPAQWRLQAQAAYQLQGKILGCWCNADQACHGDVWIEVIGRSSCRL